MTLASRQWRAADLASVKSETRAERLLSSEIGGSLRGRFTLTMAALLCPASFMIFLIIGDRGFKDSLLWGQGLGQDSRSIVMLAPEFDSLSPGLNSYMNLSASLRAYSPRLVIR